MESYFYAQITADNICFSVSSLSGEINQQNMIRLENYETECMGKRYDSGIWYEVEEVI